MNLLDLFFRRKPQAKRASLMSQRSQPQAISQEMDAARVSQVLRAAESGNMQDFFALARDIVSGHGHTLTEFSKRKLAVLAEKQNITAKDTDAPEQVQLAAEVGGQLESLPGWYAAMVHLLDSTLYPVSVLQKVYKPSTRPGWRYELADLIPVPYHLLDYTTGTLRIKEVGEDGMMTGGSQVPDPIRYVIHRGHLLTSCPDTWGGPMRAILFWWLFATQGRDWWARFLERFGAPFMEGTYDKNDDTSRMLLERAFNSATRLFGIAVPDDASIKIHSVNATQGGDAFDQFHSVANAEISKIIVGQKSGEGKQAGIGGDGQAQAQENVRGDIRQYDAIMLAATVRTQIILPLCQLNGMLVDAPVISWGGDEADDLGKISEVLARLYQSGWDLTDEGGETFSKRLALPLQRLVVAAPPLGRLAALAAPGPGHAAAYRTIDVMAADGAGRFAEAMAGTLEPLAALVSEATSLPDLEARLLRAIPLLDHKRAAEIALGVMQGAGRDAIDNL
jgi:phage gp29-like protein